MLIILMIFVYLHLLLFKIEDEETCNMCFTPTRFGAFLNRVLWKH